MIENHVIINVVVASIRKRQYELKTVRITFNESENLEPMIITSYVSD
jgi:hypothetical protein